MFVTNHEIQLWKLNWIGWIPVEILFGCCNADTIRVTRIANQKRCCDKQNYSSEINSYHAVSTSPLFNYIAGFVFLGLPLIQPKACVWQIWAINHRTTSLKASKTFSSSCSLTEICWIKNPFDIYHRIIINYMAKVTWTENCPSLW